MTDKPAFSMKQEVTTRRSFEGRVTGRQLIDLINRELFRNDVTSEPIPNDATVYVSVPGGADWSNTDLDIDSGCPIIIRWETVEQGQ